MTIANGLWKIKLILRAFREKLEDPPVYFSLVIVLVALVSFGLGRLSLGESGRPPVRITGGLPGAALAPLTEAKTADIASSQNGEVFASANGAKYYYAHCSGLERIKKENLVSFASGKEAEAAGYAIAANCAPR